MNTRTDLSKGVVAFWMVAALGTACGDDDGTEADRLGVGAECTSAMQCQEGQECLTEFKGGYCGVENCGAADAGSNEGCPEGSACVVHTNGTNYCFRTCADKPECNMHRTLENESNCSSSVDYVDEFVTAKACVPPSGS